MLQTFPSTAAILADAPLLPTLDVAIFVVEGAAHVVPRWALRHALTDVGAAHAADNILAATPPTDSPHILVVIVSEEGIQVGWQAALLLSHASAGEA